MKRLVIGIALALLVACKPHKANHEVTNAAEPAAVTNAVPEANATPPVGNVAMPLRPVTARR